MTNPRKPIFDAVRNAAPAGLFSDPGNVLALDNLLDAFGVGREGKADPFDAALAEILKHEGGFVNHPRDPGGMTNLGVTKNTWEGWTKKPATEADMRALTPERVAPLYHQNYWQPLRCDDLPAGLALCVFDFGVNAGPARSSRYLQKLVGTGQDGVMGDLSVAAVKAYVAQRGQAAAIQAFQEARRGYYRQLPTFGTFGKGWLRRVDEVEAAALGMAS